MPICNVEPTLVSDDWNWRPEVAAIRLTRFLFGISQQGRGGMEPSGGFLEQVGYK